ncbi:MAG TPA: hypothetical protein VGG06_21410 [Thermoanaerobaculia bacterium]
MSRDYPWYEVVQGDGLEQGDILMACPVITPAPSLTFPLPDDYLPVDIVDYDVVVMTQSCDLVNEKVTDVIVCPHWDLESAGSMDRSLGNKGAAQQVLKGRIARYLMLASSTDLPVAMNVRIVDFGRIFSLPKSYVQEFAASRGQRLRLCPPYREHLAQAFARFFMRVGLPQDIDLPG